MRTIPRAIGATALIGLLAMTGCGSDSEAEGSTRSQTSESAAPDGPGGFDSEQFDEIRECLDAAGLGDALPSDLPTGRPSDLPSDMPSEPPSERPTDLPSDFPSGGPGGGGFGALNDPEVQEALEACGIDLPQRPQGNAS